MNINKKYKNPPLIEAVCEFRFDPASPWDPTIPGLLYEKISKNFPKKKKLQIHEMMFTLDTKEEAGIKHQQQFRVRERAQFLREDEKLFVQIDENLLAVNHLKPYSSWHEFFSVIQTIYNSYQEISKPKGIQRIGVRFINQIEIPKELIELKDFFNFYPFIGEKLPQVLGHVIVGTTFLFENSRDLAKVQLLSKPAGAGKSIFILDIDYILEKSYTISLSEALNWINDAHTKIEMIFEESLTNETKKLFE